MRDYKIAVLAAIMASQFPSTQATASQQSQSPAAGIYARLSKGVFQVVVESNDGSPLGSGTAWLVSESQVVTNEHVVRGGKPFLEAGGAKIPVRIERIDALNDLALLSFDVKFSADPIPIGTTTPAPGVSIYVLGNPIGLQRSISAGLIAGHRQMNGRRLIQITAPISPGSSGGPLVDENGQVVGVVVGTIESGQNLNFAVPAEFITKLLAGETEATGTIESLWAEVERLDGEFYEKWGFGLDAPEAIRAAHRERRSVLLRTILDKSDAYDDAMRIASIGGHWAFVEEAYRKAMRIRPSSAEPVLGLAREYHGWANGLEGQERKNVLLEGVKLLKTAEAPALKSTKTACEFHVRLGGLYRALESHATAKNHMTKGVDACLRDGGLSYHIDIALDDLMDTSESEAEYSKWFEIAFQNDSHLFGSDAKVVAIMSASRWERRARWYETRDPRKSAASWAQAGKLGSDSGWERFCQAAETLEFWLPAEQWRETDNDTVLRYYRECIAAGAGKENSVPRLAKAHQRISIILSSRHVYQDALSHAREAVALDPEEAANQLGVARALNGLKRYLEARDASRRAVSLSDGRFSSMHFELGYALFALEDFEAALASFEKAAELDEDDDVAPYNIALCNLRLQRKMEAARWLDETLRRRPAHPRRAELLEMIADLRR